MDFDFRVDGFEAPVEEEVVTVPLSEWHRMEAALQGQGAVELALIMAAFLLQEGHRLSDERRAELRHEFDALTFNFKKGVEVMASLGAPGPEFE